MKVIKIVDKEIGSEIRLDTWYHIVLSIAVVVKIVFIFSAVFCYTYQRENKMNTPAFKKLVRIKDVSNELTILIVCLLILYVFNPFNHNFCIDKHFKTLLFVFAIFTIAEIHWVVFTNKVSEELTSVRFFLGGIGTIKQQTQRDKDHADYYKNMLWQ